MPTKKPKKKPAKPAPRQFHSLLRRRFGKLKVVGRAENDVNKNARWVCKCDCGGTCEALGLMLTADRKTHCGCEGGRGRPPKKVTVDGKVSTSVELAAQCGVTLKVFNDRLRRGLDAKAAMNPDDMRGHANATIVPHAGESVRMSELAVRHGMTPDTLRRRIRAGMTLEQALATPSIVGNPGHKLTFDGETFNIATWSRRTGISEAAIFGRLSNGWSIEDALTTPMHYTTAPKKNRARQMAASDDELFKTVRGLLRKD